MNEQINQLALCPLHTDTHTHSLSLPSLSVAVDQISQAAIEEPSSPLLSPTNLYHRKSLPSSPSLLPSSHKENTIPPHASRPTLHVPHPAFRPAASADCFRHDLHYCFRKGRETQVWGRRQGGGHGSGRMDARAEGWMRRVEWSRVDWDGMG
jgi:hypothetical protein